MSEEKKQEIFSRTERLLGAQALQKLSEARVILFGLGGVGGYTAEALARGGIGHLTLVDHDTVSFSNFNRQLLATRETVGRQKTTVAKERILSVNPQAEVLLREIFYLPETAEQFDFREYDYVIDAIDTVSGKLMLAEQAYRAKTPIISCMGTGNKLDPTAFTVADIYETSVCPLARVMRRELKKRGIPRLKVVYSKEEPLVPDGQEETKGVRLVPGSVSFVPGVAGLILAGEVIRDLICKG